MFAVSARKLRIVSMLALLLSAFNYNLLAPVVDGFHEGEYLGSLWSIHSYLEQTAPFPLLVHGPMDFIPALAAEAIGQGDTLIASTRLLNTLFAAAAWILFFDLILVCLKRLEGRKIYGTLALVLFALMIAVTPKDVVERQQAFLAIRDFFLVGMLWIFARGSTVSRPIPRMLSMALAGAVGALSLFWAYDRSLAAAAFLIGAILAMAVQRNWRDPAALILGAAVALSVTPLIAPVGSVTENLGNLLYWIRYSSEVWHIAVTPRALALPTALAMAVLLAIFSNAAFDRFRASPRDLVVPLIAGLLALQAFFLLKYVNLPRLNNNYYFVWPFVLLVCLTPIGLPYVLTVDAAVRSALSKLQTVEIGRRGRMTLVAAALSLAVIASNNMFTAAVVNAYRFLAPPSNESLLPAAVQNLEERLEAPAGCVLLWSNEGIIANALERPICTRYVYPVYVSRAHESELLAEIVRNPPAVVVFDSPFWSMSIYGRSMRDRLPAVYTYLRTNYEMVEHQGYVFGVLRRRDGGATPTTRSAAKSCCSVPAPT